MRIEPLKQRACIAALLAGSCLAAQASQPNPKPPAHFAGVRGRFVDEAGTPLAECRVTFRGKASSGPGFNPKPLTTGKDGRFEFRFPADSGSFYSLRAIVPGRVPYSVQWIRFRPGQIDDVGALVLRKGVSVSCKLVDTAGKPFPEKTTIRLNWRRANTMVGNRGANGPITDVPLISKDGGPVLTSRYPITPATWRVSVNGRRALLVKPREIIVPEGGVKAPILITLKLAPTISGRLLDLDGKPIPGAKIRLMSGLTRADGSFLLLGSDRSPGRVPLVVEHSPGFEPVTTKKTHAWGATDVVLRLRPALTFSLRVVEKGSGLPVTDFAVECDRVGANRRGPRLAGTHKGGLVKVTDVYRGLNRVRIFPKSYRLRVTGFREFVASDKQPGPSPAVIKVEALTPLKVHVLDKKGRPMQDVLVEVLQPGQDEVGKNTVTYSPRRNWGEGPVGGLGYHRATLISRARTNIGGHCIVYGQQGWKDLAIRVTTKEGRKHVRHDVKFGGKNVSLRIQIE